MSAMLNQRYGERVPNGRPDGARTDEELMVELAHGRQEALGPLYSRYAGLIYHLTAQTLDRSAAEEMVQEVFLTVWRRSDAFDPSQGAFRPWLLRLTHWRILNELRRRSRRPQEQVDSGESDEPFPQLPDGKPGPEETAWEQERGELVHSALESLPPKQREAVTMAFLNELTHEEVAQALNVPLGTAKTRIRSGLQALRLHLAPVAASLLGLGLVVVGVRYVQSQLAYERDERALSLVTTSELVPLRLTPASANVPAGAHANYRGRAGNQLAVLTTEALPAPPAGQVYQAWAGHGGQWTSLGTFVPAPDGTARVIAENPALATTPDALEISLEPTGGSSSPTGPVVLSWTPSP
jgi:RNA polymerase sigma-70 factor (ECF subfamily)